MLDAAMIPAMSASPPAPGWSRPMIILPVNQKPLTPQFGPSSKSRKALQADPSLARKVGEGLFPPEAANLIATIVERDAPFYDPAMPEETVSRMNAFAQSVGQLSGPVPYEQVIAARCVKLWKNS